LPDLIHGAYRQQMHEADTPFETEWLQGSCLLMRRETYASVDGFDDGFFLYLEDTDICQRVHQMGLNIVYVPQAVVSHVGGATTAKYPTLRVRSYHYSPIYYHRKQGHHAGVKLLKTVFTLELGTKIIARSIINRLRRSDARQKHVTAEIQTLRDLWSF
jgi:N-acetylglucosaminyl-diphospho-decaprenol L-rhamnosyltransferase